MDAVRLSYRATHVWFCMMALVVLMSGITYAKTISLGIEVSMPQIDTLALDTWDDEHAWAINEVIRERAMSIITELLTIGNVWGGHDVYVDRPDLLSVMMQYSGYQIPMAHPMHFRASVVANPTTGQVYSLRDLFADDRYIRVLSEVVKQQIIEKDVYTFDEFESIPADQEFYITQDALVLYYQVYEIAPYVWGFPEFEIPLSALQDIVMPGGPLDLGQ